jgi:hypothetical protein
MSVYKWSTTAASNDDIDSTINWQEGQSPASVNNSSRAMMAAIKKWFDDLSGNLVTAGTSTAYTLTTNQVFTALTDGIYVRCRLDETSGVAPTLNVDSLGAKPIQYISGTAPTSGVLLGGAIYTFTYDSSADAWIVEGAPSVVEPVGTLRAYVGTTAPAGYVRANGRTIGNAASSASERANADTAALFTLLWDSYADAQAAVSSGRGASAAADYAANKTIALPDLRGRALFGLDDMGNSAAGRLAAATIDQTTNGATGGADTVTLTRANLPNDTVAPTVTITDPGHFHTATLDGNEQFDATNEATAYAPGGGDGLQTDTKTTGITATSSFALNGGVTQTAVDKLPPAFLTTWLIKL